MKLPRYILIDTSKLGSAGLEEAYFIQEKGIALDDHESLEVFKEIWEDGRMSQYFQKFGETQLTRDL